MRFTFLDDSTNSNANLLITVLSPEGPRVHCFLSAKVQLPNQGIQWHLNPVAITITSGESIELDASLQAKNSHRQNHEVKIFQIIFKIELVQILPWLVFTDLNCLH